VFFLALKDSPFNRNRLSLPQSFPTYPGWVFYFRTFILNRQRGIGQNFFDGRYTNAVFWLDTTSRASHTVRGFEEIMMQQLISIIGKGGGWRRDLPDFRDYTMQTAEVKTVLAQSQPLQAASKDLPKAVDLRAWCSPIEDQGTLGACTAHAGMALFEYYQTRTFGKHIDGSRLFLYKVTRRLMELEGDTGAYLRDTMKAMVLFGAPPERFYPYNIDQFDVEPPAFCYAFAQNYKAIKYYRLDPAGEAPPNVLKNVKCYLAAGLPCMFGFTVYTCIGQTGLGKGEIPFPLPQESAIGGHAVVAVGYSDSKKIANEKGALLIRNSWGATWGEAGYGWLPYRYVLSGLAVDFWSLVQSEFVDSDLFK
jgi:C1A family cysteine protease